MTELENLKELDRLLKGLANEPQTLQELWDARPLLWRDLGWAQSQLKLWLYCQPTLKRISSSLSEEQYGCKETESHQAPDLSEEIAKIVQGHGKPMPLAQLKNKLPAGVLATEPMLKAAINNHPNLQLVGPMVKLN